MTVAEAFPLSWPEGWPRTDPAKRKRAQFSTSGTEYFKIGDNHHSRRVSRELTIYAGMRRLTDELARLGVRSNTVIVSTNVELRQDGQPRSDRRPPTDPGVAVYFQLKGHDRVLACDKWDRVPDNMAAIAGHIDAIRRQERYGVGTMEQAFAGYAALPPPAGGAPILRPWREVLGMGEMTGPNDLMLTLAEGIYRKKAKNSHPDTAGGDHDAMAELTRAIEEARRELV